LKVDAKGGNYEAENVFLMEDAVPVQSYSLHPCRAFLCSFKIVFANN